MKSVIVVLLMAGWLAWGLWIEVQHTKRIRRIVELEQENLRLQKLVRGKP